MFLLVETHWELEERLLLGEFGSREDAERHRLAPNVTIHTVRTTPQCDATLDSHKRFFVLEWSADTGFDDDATATGPFSSEETAARWMRSTPSWKHMQSDHGFCDERFDVVCKCWSSGIGELQ